MRSAPLSRVTPSPRTPSPIRVPTTYQIVSSASAHHAPSDLEYDDDDDDTPQRRTESQLFQPLHVLCVPALVSAAAEDPETAGIIRGGLKQLLLDVQLYTARNRPDTTVGGNMSISETETNNEAHHHIPPGKTQRET